MPVVKHQSTNRNVRLLAAVALPLFLTACPTDNTSLLDLESLFPAEVFTATNENGQITVPTQTEMVNGVQPPVVEVTTANPSDQLSDVSLNRVPAELQPLVGGAITFTSRFDGTGNPIEDVFQFSPEDYELLTGDNNPGALSVVANPTISVCTFIPATNQYLCLRSFDLQLQNRVWHLFNLQSETTGSGVFEFCTEADSQQACSDKLFSDPDGTDEVTISRSIAQAFAPRAAPYFAYGEQGTVTRQSSSVVISEPQSQAVYTLISQISLAGASAD